MFPKTVIDRGLGDATSHYMYEAAKAGDVESAYILAKDLVLINIGFTHISCLTCCLFKM